MAKRTRSFERMLALIRELEPQMRPDVAESMAQFAVDNKEYGNLLKQQVRSERIAVAERRVASREGERMIEARRRAGGVPRDARARETDVLGRVSGKILQKDISEELKEQREQGQIRARRERLVTQGIIDPEEFRYESARMRGPEATQEFLEAQSEAQAGKLGKLRQRMMPGARTNVLEEQRFMDPYGDTPTDVFMRSTVTNRPTDRVETFILEEDINGRFVPKHAKEVFNEPSVGRRRRLAKGFQRSPIYQHAIQFATSQGKPLSQSDIEALPRKIRRVIEKYRSPNFQVFENVLPGGKKTYGVIRRGFTSFESSGAPIVKTLSISNEGKVKAINEFMGTKVKAEDALDYVKGREGFTEVKRDSLSYKKALVKGGLRGGQDVRVFFNPTSGETLVTGIGMPGRFKPRQFAKSEAHDVGEGSARKGIPDQGRRRRVTVGIREGGLEAPTETTQFKFGARGEVGVQGGTYAAGVGGSEQLRRDMRAAGLQEGTSTPAQRAASETTEAIPLTGGKPEKRPARPLVMRGRETAGYGVSPIPDDLGVRSEIRAGILRRLKGLPNYKNNPIALREAAEKEAIKLIEEKGYIGAIEAEIEETRKDIKRILDSGKEPPQRLIDRVSKLESTALRYRAIDFDESGMPTRATRQEISDKAAQKRVEELRRSDEGVSTRRQQELGRLGSGELMARRKPREPLIVPVEGPRRGSQAHRLRTLLGDRVYERLIAMSGGDDIERTMNLVEKLLKRGSRSHPLLRALGVSIPTMKDLT